MGTRLELHALLEGILGDGRKAYFQPPASVTMTYPTIVYHRDDIAVEHANNLPYSKTKKYQVTVIDKDPDSEIPDKISDLPMCTFSRAFKTANLNHDIFELYF